MALHDRRRQQHHKKTKPDYTKSAPSKQQIGKTGQTKAQQAQKQKPLVVQDGSSVTDKRTIGEIGQAIIASPVISSQIVPSHATPSKQDDAPLPADGVNVCFIPKPFNTLIGSKHCFFLRPSKDMKLEENATYAVRANEKYLGVKAMIAGERAYVRQALLQTNKLLVHAQPGKHPLLILHGFRQPGTETPQAALKRLCDSYTSFSPEMEVPEADSFKVQYSLNHTLIRIVCLSTEVSKLPTDARVRDGHVLGTKIATLKADEATQARLVEAGFSFLHYSDILSDDNIEKKFTLKFKKTVSPATAINAANKIMKNVPGCRAIFKTFSTLRVTCVSSLKPQVLRQVRAIVDSNLDSTYAIPDEPMTAWKSNPEPINQAQDDPPEPLNEAPLKPGSLHRIARCNYLPQPEEFEHVAKALGATIAGYGQSLYTDAVMSCLLLFEGPAAERVRDKTMIAIHTPYGRWLVSPRGVEM